VDRTILPATAGEDVSDAVGAAVVRVREHRPEYNPEYSPVANPVASPKAHPYLIRARHRLLKESQSVKGSQ
jgi:hypothetical protein